ELIADGVVHIVGVCLGLVAATALIVLTAVYASAFEIAVVSIYVAGLLAMLTLSAMYNLWPVSRAKWVLRRFDHSAIYLLIAATYTPFIVALRESYLAIVLLIGVWCAAIAGVVLKLALPGRYEQVTGKVVVVTGGGNGIGKAMCEAFHRAGAAKVVVADIDPDGARAVATPIGGAAFKCDVGKEKDVHHVIEETEHQFGPIALFCSNAGIGGGFDPLSVKIGRAHV